MTDIELKKRQLASYLSREKLPVISPRIRKRPKPRPLVITGHNNYMPPAEEVVYKPLEFKLGIPKNRFGVVYTSNLDCVFELISKVEVCTNRRRKKILQNELDKLQEQNRILEAAINYDN